MNIHFIYNPKFKFNPLDLFKNSNGLNVLNYDSSCEQNKILELKIKSEDLVVFAISHGVTSFDSIIYLALINEFSKTCGVLVIYFLEQYNKSIPYSFENCGSGFDWSLLHSNPLSKII